MRLLRHLAFTFSIFATPALLFSQSLPITSAFTSPVLKKKAGQGKIVRADVPWTVINASLSDRAGNRWIASFEGLYRLPKSTLETGCFSAKCGHNVDADRAGYAQHVEQTSGRFQTMQPIANERFFHAYGLAEDAQGRVWVGSMQHGLRYFDGKTFRQAANPEILASPFVRTLHYQKTVGLWVGTEKGLYLISETELKKDQPSLRAVPLGEAMGSIYSMLGEGSRLWLASEEGLFEIENAQIKRHIFNGLPVRSLSMEPGGKIWVGTQKGLFEKTGDDFRAVNSLGLDKARVVAINRESNGTLWLAVWKEDQEVYQLFASQEKAGQRTWKAVEVTKTNEAAMPYFMQTDEQHRLWLGTNQGLFLAPRAQPTQKLQPTLFRSSFALDPKDDDC
jgi:ligand-binding sensor domain-containing protein